MPLGVRVIVAGALCIAAAACDSPPSSAGLPEWTPQDHDRSEETARAQQQGQAAPAQGGNDTLVEAAWGEQCAACHGRVGRGDGPTGPMVHAADLTDPAWQASVTDKQMAAVIAQGKGKMPAFPDLPPDVVTGLVARIRSVKGR